MSSRDIKMMEMVGDSSTSNRTWGLCTSSETDQLIQKVPMIHIYKTMNYPCMHGIVSVYPQNKQNHGLEKR